MTSDGIKKSGSSGPKRNGGPKIFLSRVGKYLEMPRGVELINPSVEDLRRVKNTSHRIVARLDGCFHYQINATTRKNFLSSRGLAPIRRAIADCVLASLGERAATKIVNAYLNRVNRWCIQNARVLIFQSQLSREMHVRFAGANADAGRVIHNGVDLDAFKPNAQRATLEGSPRLVCSGVFRFNKRLADAVRVVNHLSRRYPKAILHILGEVPSWAKGDLGREDLSRCRFHGRIAPESLPGFYAACDAMLSLSIFDPCPNVVCEGLACGLPVISPLESGSAELIGSENGSWVVPEGLVLDYLPYHNSALIPKAPVETYSNIVSSVLEKLAENKEKARARAERSLDIRVIAAQYQAALNSAAA